jgi:tRNA pseudouridine55 synthase
MNGVLAVNKPSGMTSFDVVNMISRALKVKAGHTGTLDPMATGVMLICVGKATKLVPYLMASRKTYQATITFGIKTDSKDITGDVIETAPVILFNQKQAYEACQSMIKTYMQQVPKVSAVRVDGKRLYQTKAAVKLPEREVTIFDCQMLAHNQSTLTYEATVSKGTYIRVLSEEIAALLQGNIATTSALVRTRNHVVDLSETQSIQEAIDQPRWLDLRVLLSHIPIVDVDDPTFIYHGKTKAFDCDQDRICLFYNNQPMAMYQRQQDNIYKSERGLF